ncbi:MAG: MFS transporter, partial [Anaerolineae bacterium]|nr:MFS transporter [Anaerolineae bacterium]
GQGNAGLFVFLGIIIVVVQGGLIGPWSRKYGERRLIYTALLLLSLGLIFTSITPETPPPGYSRTALIEELSAHTSAVPTSEGAAASTNVPLPDDTNTGWLGVIWIAIALIPVSIGGGLLQPSINSLITKRIRPEEIGTVLGVSAAFISAANAVTPVFGGFVFQQFGSTVPFLAGGIIIAVLLVIALLKVQPGPEEQVAPSAA